MDFATSIEKITGIGPITQKRMKRLGLRTIRDLLFYFPNRYEDFSNLKPISKIKINEICTVEGKIIGIKTSRTWKKKLIITEALIEDQTGAVKAVWFNQPYLDKTLRKGTRLFISGKISLANDGASFSNPAYEKISDNDFGGAIHTGRLVPIYPEIIGISSRWFRYLIRQALEELKGRIPEILPQKITTENKFETLEKSLWQIHFPDSEENAKKAKERFCFEELFGIEIMVLRERAKLNKEKANAFEINLDAIKKFVASLPFKLTDGQKKSAWRILKDMEKSQPMNRLLEGDVGSGKTIVAAMAALNTAKAGWQTAFMAPTEILAKQHFHGIAKLFSIFNFNVGLLTGKQDRYYSKKLKNDYIEISRKKLLEKALSGDMNILIGTHALIQDKVKFGKLGLVILDEQHRFGVEQRAKLVKSPFRKSTDKTQGLIIPHLLSMTATPIPRTLALTIYGDLDLSLLDELPKGRKKIITKVVPPEERQETYEFIKKEIKQGRQAFVICPRIEAKIVNNKNDISGWNEVKAVKEEYEKLSKEIFPDLKVQMLHGKIPGQEKERIMKDFRNKKTDILISTSVVEVGVDIPNATVMMIEGAERFGLAQLHQFRGRVGRAGHQSYCFLLTTSPDQLNRKRLKALAESENGFKLAEKDLEIRGPGDFSGTRQWGIPDLMMSSLTNIKLVEKTREAAIELLNEDPHLKNYPELREKISTLREKIHLE
jgi:ATP-dependent DNA helicase RecG